MAATDVSRPVDARISRIQRGLCKSFEGGTTVMEKIILSFGWTTSCGEHKYHNGFGGGFGRRKKCYDCLVMFVGLLLPFLQKMTPYK